MDTRLLALVAIGGAVGAVLRYVLQTISGPDSEPYATLVINLVGSLMLGVLFGIIAAGTVVSEGSVVLLGTGLLGAFTTMSTFAMDSVRLSEDSASTAAAYVTFSIAGSLILAWLGYRAALSIAS
tara:strand:- start:2066 stop:2440 length:375 start_codon:yes stop_codon:yes gene_type:complete